MLRLSCHIVGLGQVQARLGQLNLGVAARKDVARLVEVFLRLSGVALLIADHAQRSLVQPHIVGRSALARQLVRLAHQADGLRLIAHDSVQIALGIQKVSNDGSIP